MLALNQFRPALVTGAMFAFFAAVSGVSPASEVALADRASAPNCASEGSLKSRNSAHRTTITFSNSTQQERTIDWLNYSGKRMLYKRLRAGKSYSVSTFLTHPWLIANSEGECLNVFMPVARGSRIIL